MAGKKSFLTQFRDQLTAQSVDSVNFIKIWLHYDKNKSGYLEVCELETFLADLLALKGKAVEKNLVIQARQEILNSTKDTNQDGRIELSEFAKIIPVESNFLHYFNFRNELARSDFNKIFDHYDKDKNGKLGGEELLGLLRDTFLKIGQNVSADELLEYRDRVLAAYDYSGDHKLSRDELGMLISVEKK